MGASTMPKRKRDPPSESSSDEAESSSESDEDETLKERFSKRLRNVDMGAVLKVGGTAAAVATLYAFPGAVDAGAVAMASNAPGAAAVIFGGGGCKRAARGPGVGIGAAGAVAATTAATVGGMTSMAVSCMDAAVPGTAENAWNCTKGLLGMNVGAPSKKKKKKKKENKKKRK